MKNLITLLLFIAPLYCSAQTDTTRVKQIEKFCIVDTYASGRNFEAYLEDGVKKTNREKLIKNDQGKTMLFSSLIAVLDYMSQRGWILVSSTLGVTRGSSSDLIFIFKKPV